MSEVTTYIDLHSEEQIESFVFPDGQPHIKLLLDRIADQVHILARIRTPDDLFKLGMLVDLIRDFPYHSSTQSDREINVIITYLMGARMDRAISVQEPYTLRVVGTFLNAMAVDNYAILDPHSHVALAQVYDALEINNTDFIDNVLFGSGLASQAIEAGKKLMLVAPDKGAKAKVERLTHTANLPMVQCLKHRDPATGKLSGFSLEDPVNLTGYWCVIADDICDGGWTFTGAAEVLREAGAEKVFLAVTHGLFTKGLPLAGIDHVYTTDSTNVVAERGYGAHVSVLPWRGV